MQKTKIEYLTHTWNPFAMRCTPVSAGCKNCWHLRMADRLAGNPKRPEAQRWAYAGLFSPKLVESRLEEPLRLKKSARIGVQFMGDLFHEEIPAADIVNIYEIMSYAKHHTFIVLTKRPERIASVLYDEEGRWYLGGGDYIPNIWLGVSVENQKTADDRIPLLLQIPAAVRFVSVEPQLEQVNLHPYLGDIWGSANWPVPGIGWVICGAESGAGARSFNENWARSLRDQCLAPYEGEPLPFFYKQRIENGKKILMPELDGRVWDQYPNGG